MPSIHPDQQERLYRYLNGIQQEMKCKLYAVGGVQDHIHILTSLRTTLPLSRYVETIKTGTTNWIRRESVFRNWPGWQDGYGAFTVSALNKEAVSCYVKNQEQHHKQESFQDEYRRLMEEAGIEFDERYLFD